MTDLTFFSQDAMNATLIGIGPAMQRMTPHPLQVLVDCLQPLEIPLLVLSVCLLVLGIWYRRKHGRKAGA